MAFLADSEMTGERTVVRRVKTIIGVLFPNLRRINIYLFIYIYIYIYIYIWHRVFTQGPFKGLLLVFLDWYYIDIDFSDYFLNFKPISNWALFGQYQHTFTHEKV